MHPVNTESLMNARFSLGRVSDEKKVLIQTLLTDRK